jgi:hypothetical protein
VLQEAFGNHEVFKILVKLSFNGDLKRLYLASTACMFSRMPSFQRYFSADLLLRR